MRQRIQWIFRSKDIDRARLQQTVEEVCGRVEPSLCPRMKLTATVEAPPRWTVIPFSSRPLVLVSIDTPDATALHAEAEAAGVGALPDVTFERFEVTTSEPVPLERPPQVGETTPGVELLTLLRRKRGLDDATFIERWQGGHTPMSIEIHPFAGYVRNVVIARWPKTATPLDGIVEQYFTTGRDLLDPTVFFGGPTRMAPNMLRVAWDIWGFIDLATIETYWVQERWLRAH